MTGEEREALTQVPACSHCGGWHARACPRVRRMVFGTDGQRLVEVEFWPHGQWPTDGIIWPEQVHAGDDET